MAKGKKVPKEEIIPDGMKKSDYADAAFRKKVTIINSCILFVFIIGIVAVIVTGWYRTKVANEEFERNEAAFVQEKDEVLAELREIEKNGGTHEDKSQVKINVTDDNFYSWIAALDASYQVDKDDVSYAQFGGAQIHLQGMFCTKEFSGGAVQYWVYRNHDHSAHSDGHNHGDGESDASEMIPIEVIFTQNAEIPADGTWVDIVGIVGPDSTKNLSGIRYAEMTIMEKPGNEYVE